MGLLWTMVREGGRIPQHSRPVEVNASEWSVERAVGGVAGVVLLPALALGLLAAVALLLALLGLGGLGLGRRDQVADATGDRFRVLGLEILLVLLLPGLGAVVPHAGLLDRVEHAQRDVLRVDEYPLTASFRLVLHGAFERLEVRLLDDAEHAIPIHDDFRHHVALQPRHVLAGVDVAVRELLERAVATLRVERERLAPLFPLGRERLHAPREPLAHALRNLAPDRALEQLADRADLDLVLAEVVIPVQVGELERDEVLARGLRLRGLPLLRPRLAIPVELQAVAEVVIADERLVALLAELGDELVLGHAGLIVGQEHRRHQVVRLGHELQHAHAAAVADRLVRHGAADLVALLREFVAGQELETAGGVHIGLQVFDALESGFRHDSLPFNWNFVCPEGRFVIPISNLFSRIAAAYRGS